MIVSVAIFAIVMVAVATAYLNLISLDRETRATSVLLTNLSFALDSMARSIRTGTTYRCVGASGDPNGSCNHLMFTDANGCRVEYLLSLTGGSHIRVKVTNQYASPSCTQIVDQQLTDARITVSNLTFIVSGVDAGGALGSGGDNIQPIVTFTVTGTTVADSQHTSTFTIQTSATQRPIDIH